MRNSLIASALVTLAAICSTSTPAAAEDAQNDAFTGEARIGSRYEYVLTDKVGRFWQPPKRARWKELVVQFEIAKNGTVSHVAATHSSGFSRVDKSAILAVVSAAPFLPLPAGTSSEIYQLHFVGPISAPAAGPVATPIKQSRASDQRNSVSANPVPAETVSPPGPSAAPRDVDFGPYMATLQRIITRAWQPRLIGESKKAVVDFKIHTDGKVSDVRVNRSSGVNTVDGAVLQAINVASPYPALPKGAPDPVDISFTFAQPGSLGWEKSGNAWVAWIHSRD